MSLSDLLGDIVKRLEEEQAEARASVPTSPVFQMEAVVASYPTAQVFQRHRHLGYVYKVQSCISTCIFRMRNINVQYPATYVRRKHGEDSTTEANAYGGPSAPVYM